MNKIKFIHERTKHLTPRLIIMVDGKESLNRSDLIYLASPLTDLDTKTESKLTTHRFHVSRNLTRILMLQGFKVFSPLVYSELLQRNMPRDFDWLTNMCIPMVKRSSNMMLLTLPGYGKSTGVRAELQCCEWEKRLVTTVTVAELKKLFKRYQTEWQPE